MHDFFLPFGVGACLTLRRSPAWVARGFPLACLGAFIYFAGVNPVWSLRYAIPESEREITVWVNHFGAMLLLYVALQVIKKDAKERSALEVQLRDALLRDEFEIDQAFVRNMRASPKDAAIVEAVLTLGASHGLEVIAEGVETQAHRDLLSESGCELFQGYLFSRPVPASDFALAVRQGAPEVSVAGLALGASLAA